MDSKIDAARWQYIPPGSLIKTGVRGVGFADHYGIVTKSLRVASLGGERRIRYQSLEDFAGAYGVVVVDTPKNRSHAAEIFCRIKELRLLTHYNLASWNCEHAARWCFSGSPKSQQVAFAGAAVVVAGFAADIISGGKVAEIALVGLLGLGLYLFMKGTPVPEDQIVTTT